MKARQAEVIAAVEARFSDHLQGFENTPVVQAMRYATTGGKRIRAFLAMEGAALHGISDVQSVWPGAAIEAMHAYSLIHDDLPCMDDDAMRRGQPTVHIKWDEATAVLAGDALQALAFEMVCAPACSDTPAVRVELALSLAQASGGQGMVLGQALDIAAESVNRALSLEEITHLQAGKTGALIKWAALVGPRMAQADLMPLTTYSEALGLAFQIQDDVIDVTGDADAVGKAVGKDEAAGKATFVSLLGLDEAKRRAESLVDQACDALSVYGGKAETLAKLARFVIARQT
jgi:farnesyl diphosphate synthase